MPVAAPALDRMMRRVTPQPGPLDSECWICTIPTNKDGYSRLQDGERFVYAHRLSYECNVGPIPEGLCLDHLCRVTTCVNPAHLEPVTEAENIRRRFEATGTGPYLTHCKHGHSLADAYRRREGGRSCRTCSLTRRTIYRRRSNSSRRRP